MTFLELCQDYRAELGIPGNGPHSVVNQDGELRRVVDDIRRADMDIQRRWQDWYFMWAKYSAYVVPGDAVPSLPKPADFGVWNTDSFYINAGTKDMLQLGYKDYDDFRETVLAHEVQHGRPLEFTFTPSGIINLSPVPEDVEVLTAEYWRRAMPLQNDTDTPLIPEEFHRIIGVRAKMYYAEREDATEIMVGAASEFDDLMFQLEASQLRGRSVAKQGRAVRPNAVVSE